MSDERPLWRRRLLAVGVAVLGSACLGVFMAVFLVTMNAIESLLRRILEYVGLPEAAAGLVAGLGCIAMCFGYAFYRIAMWCLESRNPVSSGVDRRTH